VAEVTAPLGIIDSKTSREITDFAQLVITAVNDRGEAEFGPLKRDGCGPIGDVMCDAVTGEAHYGA
jgi:hypothetical protein